MDKKNIIYMRKVRIISLALIVLVHLSGCKKAPKLHKITYNFQLLQQSKYGSVTPIYLGVAPSYKDQPPKMEGNLIDSWNYTYLGLKDGDRVSFSVQIPLSIYYEMKIYVDDKELLYKRIKTSDSNYYSSYILESRGIDTTTGVQYLGGDIVFIYNENG